MDLNAMESLKYLEQLKKIKQREVYCPMIKTRAITTPLMTIDDLVLKTSITSPDLYDQELSHLIYSHTSFPEVSEKINFSQFIETSSYIDRQVLIWGIFASTYGTLGKLDVTCPHCSYESKMEILAEDLMQEDTLTVWDKDLPYNEYILIVDKVFNLENLYKLEFHTSIASIKQHLDILRLIDPEKLKLNYQKFGSILSKSEELTSVTRLLKLYRTAEDQEPIIWAGPQDIHAVIRDYITLDMADEVLDKYNEHFSQYVPKFRKPITCVNCNNLYYYSADPEVVLFRNFLRG